MHYVCTGDCAGEADRAGVCQAEGCTHEGEALTGCDCEDGLHAKVLSAIEAPDVDEFADEEYEAL